MPFPKTVKLVEVSPRDGLQNEAQHVPTSVKIDFINRLAQTGLSVIEATSFVSPKWIPQLADHQDVFAGITAIPSISYPVFVPNLRGLENALTAGVKEIAIFSTPSEEFSLRNINCSVTENLRQLATLLRVAKDHAIRVRGYISCVLGCPYQGAIDPGAVAGLAEQLIQLGCYEISLGDTIGVGTVTTTRQLLEKVIAKCPVEKLAVHFHDTFGQALVNIYVALEQGIAVIDSSVGGLGGCPYAKSTAGNVATEDVLFMLNGMGIETGVDLEKIVAVAKFITTYLNRTPPHARG